MSAIADRNLPLEKLAAKLLLQYWRLTMEVEELKGKREAREGEESERAWTTAATSAASSPTFVSTASKHGWNSQRDELIIKFNTFLLKS